MQNNTNLLQHAIARLQQGRFEEAGAIARQIIAKAPENGDANLMLGVVASQRGNHDLDKTNVKSMPDNKPLTPVKKTEIRHPKQYMLCKAQGQPQPPG